MKYYPERPQDPANKSIMYSKISEGNVVLGSMIERSLLSHCDGDIDESLQLSLHIGCIIANHGVLEVVLLANLKERFESTEFF